MRCDGSRPCQRCARNDAECQYFDAVKDVNILRIERLEAEVEDLKAAMNHVQMSEQRAGDTATLPQHSPAITVPTGYETGVHGSPHDRRSVAGSTSEPFWKQPSMNTNAVEAGLVTLAQATFWFQR